MHEYVCVLLVLVDRVSKINAATRRYNTSYVTTSRILAKTKTKTN